jgi:hypothetical protein
MVWQYDNGSTAWQSKAKKMAKAYPNEMKRMLDNLDRYLQGLNSGLNPLTYHPGFLHRERSGAKAIDASGLNGAAQTRLYVYPEIERQLLHVITVGDKHSQDADNQDCADYIANLKD